MAHRFRGKRAARHKSPSVNKILASENAVEFAALNFDFHPGAMLAWLFSGYFQAYPNLKIALSEGEVGWIPYFIERAQYVYDTDHHWIDRGYSMGELGAKSGGIPFEGDLDVHALYLDHVYGCFLDDKAGLKLIDECGEDNIMVEVDYPHSDTTWPHSIKLMKERVADLTPAQQHKVLRGNAERLFRFSPADPPTMA